MGSSSSKVAKRTLKGQQAIVKAPKPSQQSMSEAEQHSLEQQSLEQGMADMSEKDPHMGALLDKLQGSISGRHIDIRHAKENEVAIRESKEQRDAGRLRISSLRALLAEGAAAEAGAHAQKIDALASKYGVDAATLGKVLKYTRPLELASEDASQ